MPLCPSSMLYDSAKMIMMPICDISVRAKPLLKKRGITRNRKAVKPQTTQRPKFSGR